MKLLIATPLYPPQIGGPATYAKILEEELPKLGVEVRVLPFSDTKQFPKYMRHFVYAYKLFRATHGVDAILALDPVSVGLPASIVAFIRGKKFVLKVVGDYAWEQGQQRFEVKVMLDEFVRMPSNKFFAQVGFLRMVQTFVAGRAVHIIVPSRYLQSIIEAWGVSKEKVTVIYNAFAGIEELPSRDTVRAELSIHATSHVIVSAGRLVPWKGFALLIAVVANLRTKYPDMKLFIAGGGPDEVVLQKLIVEKNLAGTVVLLGNTDRAQLMKYIRAGDCFVLNTGYEGLSHQLLEVLAVGTPIVTTHVGGNVELVEDEVTGLLVPFNDGDALRSAIVRMLDDERLRHNVSEQGKSFVSQFTINRMAGETLRTLDKIPV